MNSEADNLFHFTKIENFISIDDRVEIPCKDMDLDCLPDTHGSVPFGNYEHCYMYDPRKGKCPFLPFRNF
ncbi:hypothetical protein ACFL7D_03925 [candidate division KSB1 bacterium]